MDFKTLKKNSGQKAIEALNAELEKSNTSYSNEDDRYWMPTIDKAGNSSAVIRFMPAPQGEDVPWVKYYDHGFEGPGGWYIEKSLTTLGKDDPVSDHNSELWKSNIEANRKLVSTGINGKNGQKRRMSIVSNIFVVSDPGKPECEGKNYLYRYGAKIFDKMMSKMHPEFEGDPQMNPFDFWEGANFKLRIRKVAGQTNYDNSEFSDRSSLFNGDDKKLEELYNKLYSLKEINDPKHFKTYEELKERLCRVLAGVQPTRINKLISQEDAREIEPKKQKESVPFDTDTNVDEDEDMKTFFAKLKEEA